MKPTRRLLTKCVKAMLVAVFGVFLIASCASPQGSSDDSLGAKELQNLSPFEKSVLKDKHVTQTEFDESRRVYTECASRQHD